MLWKTEQESSPKRRGIGYGVRQIQRTIKIQGYIDRWGVFGGVVSGYGFRSG
jgi:hypothetical protein